MSLVLGDNFDYKSSKPLDNRLKYDTVAQMKAVADSTMYDGCTAYNKESDKTYQWKSTNTVDETLGRWREFSSGGGGGTSDYSDLSNKPQIEGVTLSGNKSASDLGLVTKAVNDLVNYWLKTETYSKTEVDTIVTAIKNSRFEVVATLPTTDIKTNVIYLVPKADAESGDIKDEYINLDGTTAGWEKIGSTEVDLSNYVSVDDLNTALADYTTTTDLTTLLNGKQDVFQKYSMPTATEELVGTMYQYMGATNATYTHGYWYECVVGTEPNTYMWHQTSVQPASSLAVEDADGTDLTQRDTMQFGAGFNATDDSENEKTVVEADVMQSGDMDDIVTPLPSIAPKKEGIKYSTTEQVVGEWIDGKPLYQKTVAIPTTTLSTSGDTIIELDCSQLFIDLLIDAKGIIKRNDSIQVLNFGWEQLNSSSSQYYISTLRKLNNNTCQFIMWWGGTALVINGYATIQYTKTTT